MEEIMKIMNFKIFRDNPFEPRRNVAVNRYKIFKNILEIGFDPNMRTTTGDTHLHLFLSSDDISKHKIENLQLCLDYGADINAVNDDEATPLHVAIDSKRREHIIEFLLKNGADVKAQDNKGRIPLHLALKRRNDEVIKWLIRYESDVNAFVQNGLTPLNAIRLRKHDPEVVELLLRHGARFKCPSLKGCFWSFHPPNPQHSCSDIKKWMIKYQNLEVDFKRPYGYNWDDKRYDLVLDRQQLCQEDEEEYLDLQDIYAAERESMKNHRLPCDLSVWEYFFECRLDMPLHQQMGSLNAAFDLISSNRFPYYEDVLQRIALACPKPTLVKSLIMHVQVPVKSTYKAFTLSQLTMGVVCSFLSEKDIFNLAAACDKITKTD